MNQMSYTKQHVDYNLPLFGYNSVIGRCVVIHGMKKDGNKRWVCANMEPVHSKSTFLMKTKTEFKGPTVTGMILIVSFVLFCSFYPSIHLAIHLASQPAI